MIFWYAKKEQILVSTLCALFYPDLAGIKVIL